MESLQGRSWPSKSSPCCGGEDLLDFLFFHCCLFFLHQFSLTLDGLTCGEDLIDLSLMQETLIWKTTDQWWWAISANWGWAQEHVLFLGAMIKTNNTLCEHSFTSEQNRSSSSLCYLCFISFYFVFQWGLCFAFTFGVNVWKHTEELIPNVASPKPRMLLSSLHLIFGRLEVP